MGPIESAEGDGTHISAWRQGQILSARDGVLPGVGPLDADALAVVVSTDCDVATTDFKKEPLVELLIARRAEMPDGNFRHGKNARCLQFEVVVADDRFLYEAHINERLRVDRRPLSLRKPSTTFVLAENELRTLRLWLTKRYFRAAFPDAFNARLAPAIPAIRKRLRSAGAVIDSFWIALNSATELPPSMEYEVQMVALMTVEKYENTDARALAQSGFDYILAEIDKCDGVAVVNEVLVSEQDLTVADMRVLSRWDWDDLTLRDCEQGEPWGERDF